ncbi:NmrA/HSCARG family protein [Pontibacter amylolyticus]|uniref:Nucleotide-diphosphate-sugar epimerase n=1 Tax=Pontibacter amylolyticus TaxID=1424080 RepID=A0ABQ1WAZ6_9BACT|nr:NmrA/HSCARG family protein [Pontibacter amylolyticus]GGG22137.1 nucleotide-diphosphate-sugar epimerase [Pontibacter amylolyticus]
MASKKIITVFGATGAQGGGVARAILSDSNSPFAVRAVTRNPDSEKARELAAMGAEVVSADIDDKEGMKRALDGAYGAYFVTFFWAHFSPEKEYAEAKSMAEAAKEAGLKHVIWSTLEDTRQWVPLEDNRMPTLQGKYKVPHFDAKGEADHFFTDLGVPTTFMRASFYWDNFVYFGLGPKRAEDGKLYLTLPMGDKKMAGIASEDIGKCAYGIFKKGDEMIGKTVGIAGEQLTGQEMAEAFTKALGQQVTYNSISPETFRSFGFPGADDLGNMFQFYRDFDEVCNQVRDVGFSKELNPELKSFDAWLAENAQRVPLEPAAVQ